MRDPALAALMGVASLGSDFGAEFGADFGDDDVGDEMCGDDDFGDDDYGADFGATHAARPPSSAALARMWQNRRMQAARANRRSLKLDPNRGSALKVERYIFTLSQNLTIGTPVALSLTGSPDCTFRPQRLTMVVPTPSFVTVAEIKMANVGIMIGPGQLDAFQFNANGVGQQMDMPTLTPANRATILGNYTGFAGGFPAASTYLLAATFIGPSTLAGGAAI